MGGNLAEWAQLSEQRAFVYAWLSTLYAAEVLSYASAYGTEQERLYGPAEERMRTFLTNTSLIVRDEFKEPADHLAIYLAVMEWLVTEQMYTADVSVAVHDQVSFLDDTLLSWLPEFSARNQTASPRFDFYPALAALLVAFVEEDARYLHEEVRLSIPYAVV